MVYYNSLIMWWLTILTHSALHQSPLQRLFLLHLCSGLTLTATEEDLKTCRLLFTSPEAILCSAWRESVQSKDVTERVVAVAIDEAHCVSKWWVITWSKNYSIPLWSLYQNYNYNNYYKIYCRSHEFRPCYGRIHEIKAFLPKDTPFFACTATATQSVRKEVVQSLEMVDCVFICVSPDRPTYLLRSFRSVGIV